MVLYWNDERYHNLDTIVTAFLFVSIAGIMFSWYLDALPNKLLIITILPVGLSHWYKRKLEKLLKTYGGADVTVGSKDLILSKPDQGFEISIKFREITSVKCSRWLLLDKMKLSLKGEREVVLVNFLNQNAIVSKINAYNKNKK